jgi:hypothetical protein
MDENWSVNSFLLSFSTLAKPMLVTSILLLFFFFSLPTYSTTPQAGCYYLGSKKKALYLLYKLQTIYIFSNHLFSYLPTWTCMS